MLSHTVEYALRAMGHLAMLDGEPATSQSIASRTSIPQGYLSKIMRDLVCADLVRSFRGRRGGFVLARPAARITILDIVNAVDPIRRIDCCSKDSTQGMCCPIHRCIDEAMSLIESRFRGATLVSILESPMLTPPA